MVVLKGFDFVERTVEKKINIKTILADLKALFKAIVLVANVLPVFTGFWLALYFTNSSFSDYWGGLLITLAGSTLIIAGALLFNNWYEVDLDMMMERTIKRPTVTGNISLKTVLVLGIVLSFAGFGLLFFTTIEAVIYAFVGWFAYVVMYTFWTKRKYTLNTVVGSLSGAVTPLIGWAVVDTAIHIVPIGLFLLLFIWQIPHTFAIAMKRSEEYRAARVPMLPVVYGFTMTKRQMFIYIVCLLPLPFLLYPLGLPFVVISTLLTIGWLILSVRGFFVNDDVKWAQSMFIYSLVYLTGTFLTMIIVTF